MKQSVQKKSQETDLCVAKESWNDIQIDNIPAFFMQRGEANWTSIRNNLFACP